MRKNISSCLRQIITIQTVFVNESGLEQWNDFVTIRAEVQALYDRSIGEILSSMQLMDNSFYRFRIRFIPEVNNSMRILYNKKYFQIKRIINQKEANLILMIIAQETI